MRHLIEKIRPKFVRMRASADRSWKEIEAELPALLKILRSTRVVKNGQIALSQEEWELLHLVGSLVSGEVALRQLERENA